MRKNTIQILAIDDDQNCRIAAARFFTLVGGHIVEAAGHGREGLTKAANLLPDIILLDMNLPDMSGTQILTELLDDKRTRDIPVIILTGQSLTETEMTRLKSCKNLMDIVYKPAKFADLLMTIESQFPKQQTQIETGPGQISHATPLSEHKETL